MTLVLVTGSRDASEQAVRSALTRRLAALPRPVTLIHGNCATGADAAAASLRLDGVKIEPYPANWNLYGGRAGPIRNLAMVRHASERQKAGETVLVWAFPAEGAKNVGTRGCYKLAKAFGVDVEHEMVPKRS